MKPTNKPTPTIALPTGILPADLIRPDYKSKVEMAREDYNAPKYTTYGGEISFELWYTERFGWAIPTLTIANASARQRNAGVSGRRSYAVAIKDGQLVSLGLGPHLKATHTVYVKASRLEALTPFLETMLTGAEKANNYRDTLSTRRMNSRRRGGFDFLQRWDG